MKLKSGHTQNLFIIEEDKSGGMLLEQLLNIDNIQNTSFIPIAFTRGWKKI